MEIEIRHAEPADYDALHAILAQPRAYTGTLQMPYPSRESWRRRLENPAEGFYSLVACVEGGVVGQLGLQVVNRPRRRHAGTIGMSVHDDWQGKGVGSALMAAAVNLADNWLNLLRLELHVYVDNEPALHLYQKFGFEIEGRLRLYAYRNGQYVDSYAMARIRQL